LITARELTSAVVRLLFKLDACVVTTLLVVECGCSQTTFFKNLSAIWKLDTYGQSRRWCSQVKSCVWYIYLICISVIEAV